MVLTCLFISHIFLSRPVDTTDVPVTHMRASKLLETMRPLTTGDESPSLKLSADDARGVITAVGSPDDIKTFKGYLSLFDVERKPVTLKVSVTSPIDKVSYESTTTVLNNQQWSLSNSDVDLKMTLAPRLNDDGTVTVYSTVASTSVKEVRTVARIKLGDVDAFEVSSKGIRQIGTVNRDPSAIVVRVTYVRTFDQSGPAQRASKILPGQ